MTIFLKIIASSIVGVLALIGFIVLWSAEGEDASDTVLIEYQCSKVLVQPEKYPEAYIECKKQRGEEPQEIKKIKDVI